MTAIAGILNKKAAAIAADSALNNTQCLIYGVLSKIHIVYGFKII